MGGFCSCFASCGEVSGVGTLHDRVVAVPPVVKPATVESPPAAPVRSRVDLTDVLFFISATGHGSIVARGACAVNKRVWNDPVIWRSIVDEQFGHDCEPSARPENKKTRLYLAAEQGSAAFVKKWLTFGASPSLGDVVVGKYSTNEYNIPLVAAIRGNHSAIAQMLLAAGADPNKIDTRCWSSPIAMAAKVGNREMFRLLVDNYLVELPGSKKGHPQSSADDAVDRESVYCDPLEAAIRHGHCKLVGLIIETYKVPINYYNDDYDLVFSYVTAAVASGRLFMLNKVLDYGALINYENYDENEIPLICAVEAKNAKFVQALLKRGADANLATSFQQKTPLIAAAQANDVIIARMLCKHGASLNAAIHYDEFNDPEDALEQGMTPLHYFSESLNPAGVRLMLMGGAESNALTFSGMSPLLLCARAVKGGEQDRVEQAVACIVLLAAAGASVNLRRDMDNMDWDDGEEEEGSESLYSACMYAVSADSPALIASLSSLGAHVHLHAASGRSTLMLSAENGFADSMRAVLSAASGRLGPKEMKAFVNLAFRSPDEEDVRNGRSAIFFCLGSNSCAEMVQMLLQAGADARLQDDLGQSVRDIACERGYQSIVSLLDNFKQPSSEKFKFTGLRRGFWGQAPAFTTSETSTKPSAPAPAASAPSVIQSCWIPFPSESAAGMAMGMGLQIALQAAASGAAAAAEAAATDKEEKKKAASSSSAAEKAESR